MISGLVLKYLNGECFVIRRGYETTLHVSSSFCLTVPIVPLKTWERWWVALVSFLIIAPGLVTMGIGLVLMLPILILQTKRTVLSDE